MMYRLTTPTHNFILQIDPREWVAFTITYAQDRKIVLEKTQADDISFEEITGKDCCDNDVTMYKMSVTLTQSDTEKFKSAARKTEVQIRCLYSTGDSFASQPIPVDIKDVLNTSILSE